VHTFEMGDVMSIESQEDFDGMTAVGTIVGLALRELEPYVRPGVTTGELDALCARFLARHGAQPAPMLLYGFPGSICISVNDEIVHGIPGRRRIQAGDLVKLDVTAELDGYIADAAVTVAVPPISPVKQRLCDAAQAALRKAIAAARTGQPLNVIGR